MGIISMKQLLEAGVHFGHQTRRWNPKMAQYIYTERNGIYIIDLQQTVRKIEEAYNFVKEISERGEEILFVGTKKQACDSVKEEAERVGTHYVNARWLGGMLTNFKTIRNRVKRLEQLHVMEEDGTFDCLPKKEIVKLRLEITKLERFIGGIKNMHKLPAALFIIDPKKEKNAVSEAKKLGIPIIAIVDTNCDPDDVDYVIPGNDDAIRSVKLLVRAMGNAVLEGRQGNDQNDNFEMSGGVENVAIDNEIHKGEANITSNSEDEEKLKQKNRIYKKNADKVENNEGPARNNEVTNIDKKDNNNVKENDNKVNNDTISAEADLKL